MFVARAATRVLANMGMYLNVNNTAPNGAAVQLTGFVTRSGSSGPPVSDKLVANSAGTKTVVAQATVSGAGFGSNATINVVKNSTIIATFAINYGTTVNNWTGSVTFAAGDTLYLTAAANTFGGINVVSGSTATYLYWS